MKEELKNRDAASALDAASTIENKLTRVGSEPGVYLLKDAAGNVLYVGKARDLKKRLAAYLKNADQADRKTGVLVKKIADIDTVITRTEKEALLLEANLIKRYRPRYNVVLKDDKGNPKGTIFKGPIAKEACERWPGIAKIASIIV